MSVALPVSGTDGLSMAMKIGRKPGWVNGIGLELCKEQGVVDSVKTFGKIKEAEHGEFLAVGGR